jgi:hypothetical protein
MNSFLMTAVASAAAAVVMVACGGGGGGEGGSANAITTDEQAKQLAARTVHAVFAADAVAFEVAQAGQVWRQGDAVIFGYHDLPCAQGSGTFTSHDSDSSASLTAGDVELFVLAGCLRYDSSRWALDGTPLVTLMAAAQPVALGAALDGAAAPAVATGLTTRVTAEDLAFGGQAMFAGQWSHTWASATDAGGAPTAQVQLDNATLTLADGMVRFDQVRFVAGIGITQLQGQVFTTISGLGDVVAGLALADALPVAPGKGWYAPTGGVVKVTTAGLTMEVAYAADGAVQLRVDNGSDGTVDMAVQTSQAELDTLLMAAPAPLPEPPPGESYGESLCDPRVMLDGPSHPCTGGPGQAARIAGKPVPRAVARTLQRAKAAP